MNKITEIVEDAVKHRVDELVTKYSVGTVKGPEFLKDALIKALECEASSNILLTIVMDSNILDKVDWDYLWEKWYIIPEREKVEKELRKLEFYCMNSFMTKNQMTLIRSYDSYYLADSKGKPVIAILVGEGDSTKQEVRFGTESDCSIRKSVEERLRAFLYEGGELAYLITSTGEIFEPYGPDGWQS